MSDSTRLVPPGRAPTRSVGRRRHVWKRKQQATREAPAVEACDLQPDAREGQAGPCGVTERSVVPMKPGNAGGEKEPQFKVNFVASTAAPTASGWSDLCRTGFPIDQPAVLPQQPLQITDPDFRPTIRRHHGIDDDGAVVLGGEPTNRWGRRRRSPWSGSPVRVPMDRLCRLGGRRELTPWRERVKWPPCVLADRVTCRRRLCRG